MVAVPRRAGRDDPSGQCEPALVVLLADRGERRRGARSSAAMPLSCSRLTTWSISSKRFRWLSRPIRRRTPAPWEYPSSMARWYAAAAAVSEPQKLADLGLQKRRSPPVRPSISEFRSQPADRERGRRHWLGRPCSLLGEPGRSERLSAWRIAQKVPCSPSAVRIAFTRVKAGFIGVLHGQIEEGEEDSQLPG